MKFLMTYEQTPNAAPPTPQQMAAIGALVERNRRAGVLLMTGGLVRPSRGIKVECQDGKFSVVDGPFAESKELIDGYALIEAPSKEEAIRLCAEFMMTAGDGKGEILQVFDPADGAVSRDEIKDHARHITTLWRVEVPRIIGRLAKILRDLSLAEEFAQDALVEALARWPVTGLPENPGAWLMVTAKHRALNALRRGRFFAELGHEGDGPPEPHATLAEVEAALDSSLDEVVQDDVLRLLFVACHPLLTRESRVALTLRTVAGLSTAEIARAFLSTETTMAQRLSRAKKTLAEAGVPFEMPPREELSRRLSSVLEVVYLVFNEGYAATAGEDLVRGELCEEALRLGQLLVSLGPDEPEAQGLLSLMWLQHSRASVRVDGEGAPVLLADQDRGRWDRAAIARGLEALDAARQLTARADSGPYALQAEIAACHARAATFAETDWKAIADGYAGLLALTPSPVVALNHALAVSKADGPAAGLAALDVLAGTGALEGYHLLPAARAEMLELLGRFEEAAGAFAEAAALATHPRQKERLTTRAASAAARTGRSRGGRG